MRKADYQALAQLIREGRAFAKVQHDSADATNSGRDYHRGRGDSLRHLARTFARSASVDPAAFLAACGIEDTPRAAPMPALAPETFRAERVAIAGADVRKRLGMP